MAVGRLKKDRVTESGNTAGRPSNPIIGDTYYNGQLGQLEIYNGSEWIALSAPPLAPTLATPTNASGSDAYSSTGGKLSVVFTRNSSGGEPIQYSAYTTEGGFSASSSNNTVTLTGLTPGTAYTVYGTVQNNFGTSINSANASAATPSTKPQAPTIGTATASNASASLTFTAGNSGGSSITNYKYSIDGTNYIAFSPPQTTSPLTISGLTNNQSYSFYLKAVNANGDSAASGQSNSITPLNQTVVDFLVVAGGGGGHGDSAGGGGAGGLRSTMNNTGGLGTLESTIIVAPSTNYTVTVGSGGAWGVNGSNSVFSTITSTGGGRGAGNGVSPNYTPGIGGSGGGASGGGGSPTGGARIENPVQGFNGGNSFIAAPNYPGGGGGGAGAVGSSSSSGGGIGAAGGTGVAVSITGSSVYYAGGGGGTGFSTNGGAGGNGGGGNGGTSGSTNGQANTGGGAGGGDLYNQRTGGSGVVILRWLTSGSSISVGAGLTADATGTDGAYSYKRFTAGSGNVSWS